MNPVEKALWFVEAHLASEITLEDVARMCGLSRFHLSRAFGSATGYSVMRYVRGRRLTEAARSLAAGAPDILSVAFDAGYGSHEAFTRAFRDQFGIPPEAARARRTLDSLALVEAMTMGKYKIVDLHPPRFETRRTFLVAGLGERYAFENEHGIPQQWQRFEAHFGHVPGQVGSIAYGVCCNMDDSGFDYISGVEVSTFDDLPADLNRVRIPEQRYAVFSHRDHIASIGNTVHTIWSKWLPESEHEAADAPNYERYDENFSPMTGLGGVEIWIPIKS